MADQNLKIHLIGMKISIREGGGGRTLWLQICHQNFKIQNDGYTLEPWI